MPVFINLIEILRLFFKNCLTNDFPTTSKPLLQQIVEYRCLRAVYLVLRKTMLNESQTERVSAGSLITAKSLAHAFGLLNEQTLAAIRIFPGQGPARFYPHSIRQPVDGSPAIGRDVCVGQRQSSRGSPHALASLTQRLGVAWIKSSPRRVIKSQRRMQSKKKISIATWRKKRERRLGKRSCVRHAAPFFHRMNILPFLIVSLAACGLCSELLRIIG